MDSVASKYISAFQKRFPNANVTWETPPDDFFETRPCKLAISRKDNPDIRRFLDFEHGLGTSPDIDLDLETFINFYAKDLD